MRRAGELIRAAVTSSSGVEPVPHRFGGSEYRYCRKEMGHVDGDRLAYLPDDEDNVIELFRIQYERYAAAPSRPARAEREEDGP